MERLGNFINIRTGKLDANAANANGKFPFFTCAVNPLKINIAAFDCECVLVAGNGDLNVKYYNGKFNAYQRTYIIESKDKNILSPSFIYRFIDKSLNQLRSQTKGGVIQYIRLNDLTDLKLNLPTIENQLQIATLLNRAENLKSQRKQSIGLIDEFLKSTFLEMFGNNTKNDKGWEKITLVDACVNKHDVKCGPFGTQLGKSEYQIDGIPVWGIPQINSQFKILPKDFVTSTKALELDDYSVIPFDIVMSRKGNVGKCSLFPKDFPKGIIHSDVLRIRTDKNKMLPEFLLFQLKFSKHVETQIKGVTKGAIMAGINVGLLKHIKVQQPPIELQTQFAQIVEKTEILKAQYQSSLQELENLYGSLSQRAFRGELNLNKAEEQVLMAAESEAVYGRIIEMKPRKCNSSEKAILAGHIINQTYKEDFGRVKFQKLLHLTEYVCKIDIGSNFSKKVAGPHDGQLIEDIESTLQRYRYYNIKQSCKGNHKVNYTPLSSVNELEDIFKSNFESEAKRIDVLLSKFKKSSWEQCEIVSTLYAVWNNRLIKKEVITDDLLKQDFLNWDKQKIKYQDRLDGALQWMKDKEVIPIGWGKLIE